MDATSLIMDVANRFAERYLDPAEEAANDGVPGALEHLEAARRVEHVLGDVYLHARAIKHYAQEARAEKAKLGTIMPDGFPY